MRECGILMPIFSLPSKYGVGDFGETAYRFIDFLVKSKVKAWQILPLVQTGYGNSPYSSVSSESFNPYYISPEELVKEGLLTEDEIKFTESEGKYVDYGFLYTVRYPLLKKAYSRFDKNTKKYKEYIASEKALDYALFMSLKIASGQKHFYEWEEKYKRRDKTALRKFAEDYSEEVGFWQFVQYEGEREWKNLKAYAEKSGVKIIGDMPLYVALDSVDVWKNPELFKLDENFTPITVAGVPPDYFCADGQLWGNPIYDYEAHQKDGFSWWKQRVKNALSLYDYIRIDHFRGLDRYYEVEYGKNNARVGEWVKVPSEQLFNAIHSVVDKERIIAEDLGIIDDGVVRLREKVGYPGMKILLFAFNGERDNLYLPERVEENSVCYTGTHDNDTLMGYIERCSEWDYGNLINGVKNSLSVMGIDKDITDKESLYKAVIELGMASKSKLFIMPFSDVIKKDNTYRINEPGTVKNENWSIRLKSEDINEEVWKNLKGLIQKYGR